MSLEQSIADLQTQAGLLLDLPQKIHDEAQVQIAAVSQLYENRLETLTVTSFVDATSGDDANPGTVAQPIKSIQKALELTPVGGIANVVLLSDIHISDYVHVVAKSVHIRSHDLQRKMTFERKFSDAVQPSVKFVTGFRFHYACAVSFINVEVAMPEHQGAFDGMTNYSTTLFKQISGWEIGISSLSMEGCKLNIPATPYGPLIEANAPIALMFSVNSYPDQTPFGKIASGITSTAGTATSGLAWLVTNLTNI